MRVPYLPIRINSHNSAEFDRSGKHIDYQKDDREKHGQQHYPEPWVDLDQPDIAEVVLLFDVVEQIDDCEYPPRITIRIISREHSNNVPEKRMSSGMTYRQSASKGRVRKKIRLILLLNAKFP